MPNLFNQPVREFIAYLRIECGLSDNTLESYSFDLKRLQQYFEPRGITEPDQLNYPILIEYLKHLRTEGLESNSIARHMATIRAFGKFLNYYNYCENDPTELLQTPTTWKKLPKTIHHQEIEKLLNAPDPNETMYWRNRALLELMYACGCRASEVGALQLDHYHREIGIVKITGKGNKQRLVPLGQPAMQAINLYLSELRPTLHRDDKPTEALFITRLGRPMDRFRVWSIIKHYARGVGLKNVHPHTIRHTFATHLLAGGADLRVVQELLGHAKVTTTQIYTHIDQNRLKSVISEFHPRG